MTLLGLPIVDGDHVLQRIGRVLGRRVNRQIETAARMNTRTSYLPVPNRTLPTHDTPMFDTRYRNDVTALIVAHLLRDQRTLLGSTS